MSRVEKTFLKKENHAYVSFDAKSVNESFARMVVMAFMTDMNPTLDELEDVKTAVSEAVTNAIIHGYEADNPDADDEMQEEMKKSCETLDNKLHKNSELVWNKATVNNKKQVELFCKREGQTLWISVVDHGVGIADVEKARQPFFTTKPEKERSGMGFVFMETFMDDIEIYSQIGEGTRVTMRKTIGTEDMENDFVNQSEDNVYSSEKKDELAVYGSEQEKLPVKDGVKNLSMEESGN